MGHLYNAKYIQYFLDVREDQVQAEYNFNPIDHLSETGRGWAVVQNQISYLRACHFNETVIIESFIRNFNSLLMEVEYTMWDVDHKIARSVLWTRFVYIEAKKHKAVAHTPELMHMFGQVVVPLGDVSFDQRVAYYRQLNKGAR
jgi:acyl-CoA thioester hydrolase